MYISLFELFSIGIGPSSSHTVGPMRAANAFVNQLKEQALLNHVTRLYIELYGSLALTGHGHGTDKAILNAFENKQPETVDPDTISPRFDEIVKTKTLRLANEKSIVFDFDNDFIFHTDTFLPLHSNGIRFTVYDTTGQTLISQVYYSIGGGFIMKEEEFGQPPEHPRQPPPYPFETAHDLLQHCKTQQCNIADIMLANEKTWHSEQEIMEKIHRIMDVMSQCIEAGCHHEGFLPGGLNVKRRAPGLYQRLEKNEGIHSIYEDCDIMNRLNLYAIAVNEENAAGGRIVTAPTNGAAGIIPAVMEYYKHFHDKANETGLMNYFLTAGAIAILYKKGASISGAEVGCQGEVGVASSMAAAGLTAALGGTPEQVENAAEIAMEHHLGMTCDPIAGLVQIPCIERNAMGAVKAVNAARMALIGDGQHTVSLDKVIATMKQTGHDMMTIYKETSQGGLAVNIPEC